MISIIVMNLEKILSGILNFIFLLCHGEISRQRELQLIKPDGDTLFLEAPFKKLWL
jgi:hypothetical protein